MNINNQSINEEASDRPLLSYKFIGIVVGAIIGAALGYFGPAPAIILQNPTIEWLTFGLIIGIVISSQDKTIMEVKQK